MEGKGPSEVARLISTPRHSITHQAVSQFRKRHAAQLAPLVAAVEQQITDYAIAQKINRIAALNEDWQRLGDVIEARAGDARYDEPGYATGLMAHSLKSVGGGVLAMVVDEFKVDTAVIAERRALARAASEELGQLPRPEIHIGDKNTFILEVRGPHDGDDIPRLG